MIHGVAMKRKKRGWTKRPKRTLGKDAKEGHNAPCNNPPNGTKNRGPEEANFIKKQVSIRIQNFYLTLAGTLK
jgi:hypothetical protein